MTGRDGLPLQRARQWSTALAAALDEAGEQLDAAGRRLAEGWPDGRGQEWTDRLRALSRAVARDADDALALGRTVDRLAVDLAVDLAVADPVGPQLGNTAARRVDDRRGVTIPQLGGTPGG